MLPWRSKVLEGAIWLLAVSALPSGWCRYRTTFLSQNPENYRCPRLENLYRTLENLPENLVNLSQFLETQCLESW
ncbi:uncharacterized [Tachysurus ichikawai]